MKPQSTLFLMPLFLLTACQSRLTGNEGRLQFQYAADDRPLDFNKPLAVGARLDIKVVEVGRLRPVNLTFAAFDEPSVLDVVAFDGSRLTIEGAGSGNALLEVEATTPDGEPVSDNVNFNARVPEVHRLSHTCGQPGSRTQAYLTGQTVYVPFELEMASGQPVIGYGYYPVTPSSDALILDPAWKGQQFMALETERSGSVVLTSDVDGTELSLELVDASAIDDVAEPIAFVLEDIDVGDTNPFYVLPRAGGLTVCQADVPFEVRSDTPDVCTVARRDDAPLTASDAQRYEYGWFGVTGVSAGTCIYTVTYPEGAGGAGVSGQFTFTIEP